MTPLPRMVIHAPLFVKVTKKKDWILNLNNYRNAHYQTLSKAKREYAKVIADQIRELPFFRKVHAYYTLYPGRNGIIDLTNVCSIHDKFALDAIVKWGRLGDDNWTIVVGNHYLPGVVDKANPRVEISLVPVPDNGEVGINDKYTREDIAA